MIGGRPLHVRRDGSRLPSCRCPGHRLLGGSHQGSSRDSSCDVTECRMWVTACEAPLLHHCALCAVPVTVRLFEGGLGCLCADLHLCPPLFIAGGDRGERLSLVLICCHFLGRAHRRSAANHHPRLREIFVPALIGNPSGQLFLLVCISPSASRVAGRQSVHGALLRRTALPNCCGGQRLVRLALLRREAPRVGRNII
eukprot:2554088-Pyramimonas_sp.AAC.1